MAFMAKRNNPPTDYSCSLHCCAGGLISSVDIFCVVFLVVGFGFFFFFWYISIKLFGGEHCVLGAGCILRKRPTTKNSESKLKRWMKWKWEMVILLLTDGNWSRRSVTVVAKVTLGVHRTASWSLKSNFIICIMYCLSVPLLLNLD